MDEYTQRLFDRYLTDAARAELVKHASAFTGRSVSRVDLGVDAQMLVGEAIRKVCEAGFPDPTDKPIAYLKRVITRLGIDQHRRRKIHNREQDRINEVWAPSASEVNDPEAALDRLTDSEQIEQAMDRFDPPIPTILRAIRDNPDLTIAEIANRTATSESAVYRAKKTVKHDRLMRELAEIRVTEAMQ